MASYLVDQDKLWHGIPDYISEIQNWTFLMRVEGMPQTQQWVVAISFQPLYPLFFQDLQTFGRAAWYVTNGTALHGPWTLREFNPRDFKLSQSHPRAYQTGRIRKRL